MLDNNEETKKLKYIKSFKRASKNKKMRELAEEGLEDYVWMLNKLDNE